jgi:hypothetical protein
MRCTLCDPIQAYSDGNLGGKQGRRQRLSVCAGMQAARQLLEA